MDAAAKIPTIKRRRILSFYCVPILERRGIRQEEFAPNKKRKRRRGPERLRTPYIKTKPQAVLDSPSHCSISTE